MYSIGPLLSWIAPRDRWGMMIPFLFAQMHNIWQTCMLEITQVRAPDIQNIKAKNGLLCVYHLDCTN